ncbi:MULTISPECIES: malonic semialdehyde reductase [Prauserella salsuginis group]|uniref:Malonic semialdehyde reductase n=1 Tax=Prauserella salsuginis TaxID=387889 RepID=A0ABW6GA86_9PSEU|nr:MULTISPECIES: malonic semialdehyde reductase [Prauserella salsuginis group]MCR3723081.1 3-hydroxypropanoate dehydrogenase [Prauserella flava]MCR3732544.1 3-hydroxypropanoate dehydrogenase [Prauserella salsuginis]
MTTSATTQALELSADAQDLLFRDARTANTFSSEPVTDEQLRAIYDLVKWAPTSMNNQPLRALVVRSDEGRQRLLKHMADGNRPKTEAAPVTVVLAADADFHENLPAVFPHAPGVKDLFNDPDGREPVARLNASLQVGYFILGVRAAGLAAGPMTGFDGAGVDAEFFADKPWKSLVVVNIGKPGENAWQERLPRLGYDEVVAEA